MQFYNLGSYELNENEAMAINMIVGQGAGLSVQVIDQKPIVMLTDGTHTLKFPLEGMREDLAVGFRPGRKKNTKAKKPIEGPEATTKEKAENGEGS